MFLAPATIYLAEIIGPIQRSLTHVVCSADDYLWKKNEVLFIEKGIEFKAVDVINMYLQMSRGAAIALRALLPTTECANAVRTVPSTAERALRRSCMHGQNCFSQ